MNKYFTLITTVGLNKIMAADRNNKIIQLVTMGVGGAAGSYVKPSVDIKSVPNEWHRFDLERKPSEGYIGGGATIENDSKYSGRIVCNVGIYDIDGDLILISALPQTEIASDNALISSYPIDIYTKLSNSSSVMVVTDTSLSHPTHKEFFDEIDKLKHSDKDLQKSDVDIKKSITNMSMLFSNKLKEQDSKNNETTNNLLKLMRQIEGKLGRVRIYMKGDIDDEYLPIQGQTLNKSDYADYFDYLKVEADTLTLPDWTSHGYLRQFSSMLAAGSTLEDEIKSHKHSVKIDNAGAVESKQLAIDYGNKTGSFNLNKRFYTNATGSHQHPYDAIDGSGYSYDVVSGSSHNGIRKKKTDWGGEHKHYIDVKFDNVTVNVEIGKVSFSIPEIDAHSHSGTIGDTGGDETRPKTTIVVYAVKVKYLTSL